MLGFNNKFNSQSRFGRLIGIPILAFIITLFISFDHFLLMDFFFLRSFLISFIITSFLWIGNYEIFLFARKRYNGYADTKKRVIYQTITNVLYTLLITFIIYYSCCLFLEISTINLPSLLIMTFIPTIMMILVYETVYTFYSWKAHINEIESLKVENVKSQLNSLRSQLDPHFLFNSLNTLVSLVGEQNKPAQDFLLQLSDVYRYLLINRENNEVPLKEEIDFLQAYIYLNKIRFRENLQVEINIDPSAYLKFIAPLSLQMLVENAIKHNAATSESPLFIGIQYINSEYIQITNNIQPKKTLTNSTGVGLQNITNRYKLLTKKEVKIYQTTTTFTVEIPLLSQNIIS